MYGQKIGGYIFSHAVRRVIMPSFHFSLYILHFMYGRVVKSIFISSHLVRFEIVSCMLMYVCVCFFV